MHHVVRRRLAVAPVAALLLVGLAACGGNNDDESSGSPSIDGVTVTGDFGKAPTVKVEDGTEISKTETETVITGTGPKTTADGQALLNIYVWDASDNKEAYSSYTQAPQPGQIAALPGALASAMTGVPRGSRVVVAAPVKDTLGESGSSNLGLDPDESAVFVVDVVSVPPADVLDGPDGEAQAPKAGLPTVVTDKSGNVTGLDYAKADKKPSDQLQVQTLIQGTGPAIPDRPVYVTFDYYGEVYGKGTPFDESYTKTPAPFPVGIGGLIQGWDTGLVGVKVGSRILMVVPPELGYKDKAQTNIPANSTLVFVIDVLGVDTD